MVVGGFWWFWLVPCFILVTTVIMGTKGCLTWLHLSRRSIDHNTSNSKDLLHDYIFQGDS